MVQFICNYYVLRIRLFLFVAFFRCFLIFTVKRGAFRSVICFGDGAVSTLSRRTLRAILNGLGANETGPDW